MLVRNIVFFKLFLCYFSQLFALFYPLHTLFSQFHSSRKDNMCAIDQDDVAEHNVQLQQTTRFKVLSRGLASGWFYKSISPLLSLAISLSKMSPSSPDRGI